MQQALTFMEQLTIGQLQILYEKAERRKKQNLDAFNRWKERNPELHAERKKLYNRINYERKKAKAAAEASAKASPDVSAPHK